MCIHFCSTCCICQRKPPALGEQGEMGPWFHEVGPGHIYTVLDGLVGSRRTGCRLDKNSVFEPYSRFVCPWERGILKLYCHLHVLEW